MSDWSPRLSHGGRLSGDGARCCTRWMRRRLMGIPCRSRRIHGRRMRSGRCHLPTRIRRRYVRRRRLPRGRLGWRCVRVCRGYAVRSGGSRTPSQLICRWWLPIACRGCWPRSLRMRDCVRMRDWPRVGHRSSRQVAPRATFATDADDQCVETVYRAKLFLIASLAVAHT